MRRKAFALRITGISLFCVLFSLVSLAQTDKSAESAALSDDDQTAENTVSGVRTPRCFFPNKAGSFRPETAFSNFAKPARSLFFRRVLPLGDSLSKRQALLAFRRGGIQTFISSASGITQISEVQALERRGLISSNGQRPTSNLFTVEEMSANLGVGWDETSVATNAGALPTLTASGGINSILPASATSEIVVQSMATAKEQRVAGSQINFTSRSGTNEFHGSAFETFGNERLNANDFFANERGFARAPSRLNQFGATLGGFFVRDKAFFFGNYEGLRLRQAAFNVSEVPNFSARAAASPIIRPIFDAFPVANGADTTDGFAEFASVYTNGAANDIFGLRIDMQPTNDWRVSGRYNFADTRAISRGDKNFSLNTLRESWVRTGSLSLSATFVPNSNTVIKGGVNFSRNRIAQAFSLDDFGGAQISPALFSNVFDFLKYDFTRRNAAIASGSEQETTVNQFQTNGSVDWITGNHQFTFGTDFRRLALDIGAARRERNVLFAGINQSLNGTASRITELSRDLTEKPVLDNFSLYAQDSWRIFSRLVLNLGLRWDADFAPEPDAPNVRFQNSTPQMPDNLQNFAPRASVAYNLPWSRLAVIRGGAGLYFNYGNAAASEIFANSFPFASGNFAQNAVFTAAPVNALKPLLTFSDDLQTPRAWHIFAEYQQELFRNHVFTATYTNSRGRKLFLTRTLPGADPNFNYIRLTDNDAESDFNSLQLRFERRFSQNFSFNARYTLSKSKDNFSLDSTRETNFVPADLASERGSSDFDVRHQLSLYGIYEIPVFFSGGWKKRLTEDWSISAFANARTAFPLTVGFFRVNDLGKEFVRANLTPGAPVFLNEDAIKSLNPNAFSRPVSGQGSLARNALRGFPLFQLDASLQRRIRFTNEMRLDLSINAYNVLNNANFADMSGNLGTQFQNGNFLPNPYFGKAVSTFGSTNFTPFYLYGGARTIHLSAKFVF